jgi:hypothetical protein
LSLNRIAAGQVGYLFGHRGRNVTHKLAVSLCIVGVFVVFGCGKSTDEKKTATTLKLFGSGYQIYSENNQRPPQNAAELKTVISSDEPIDFDKFHIIWGVDLKSITSAKTVIAYEKSAAESGGHVLFHDGEVVKVTAEEFAKLPKATAAKPIAERNPDVTLTPAEYIAEFKTPGGDMARKYRGKVIELKGVSKGRGPLGDDDLELITPGKESDVVYCRFAEKAEFLTKVARGQEVTIRGIVREPQGSPILIECSVAKTGPFTGLTMTAEELGKDFEADKSKGYDKYSGKSFLLSGEVVSTSTFGIYIDVMLKGGQEPVACVLRSDPERDKKFTPGAKVKFYAECDGNPLRLTKCELISK